MMLSKYKNLIVNLFFFPFLEWEFLSDCAFPDHSLLVPFFSRMCICGYIVCLCPTKSTSAYVGSGCSSLINENDIGISRILDVHVCWLVSSLIAD